MGDIIDFRPGVRRHPVFDKDGVCTIIILPPTDLEAELQRERDALDAAVWRFLHQSPTPK